MMVRDRKKSMLKVTLFLCKIVHDFIIDKYPSFLYVIGKRNEQNKYGSIDANV